MSSRAKPAHPHLSDSDILDARDVASLLHMPLSTVLEFARRGILPGHKLGRRWIFLRDEVETSVRDAPGPRGGATPAGTPAIAQPMPPRNRRGRYPRAAPSREAPPQPKLFG
jgi:excisionase family DNA binding protein